MGGRFSLAKNAKELAEAMPGFEFDTRIAPRFNIAPSQPLVTILNDGRRKSTFTQWGLIPFWAKDALIGSKLINARGETVAEKPSFRHCFKRKRCLIPADGWFEWKAFRGQKMKQPLYFYRTSHEPFCLAGLWDEWHDADGGLLITSAIITTRPNEVAARGTTACRLFSRQRPGIPGWIPTRIGASAGAVADPLPGR